MTRNYSNLIPDGCSRRLVIKSLIRRWTVVLALASVATVIAIIQWQSECYQLQRQISNIQKDTSASSRLTEESDKLVTEVGRLKAKWDELAGLSNLEVPGAMLAELSLAAQPYTNRIRLTSIVIRQSQASEDESRIDHLVVDIQGVASDPPAIGEFLGELRRIELIDKAELVATHDSTDASGHFRSFQIQSETAIELLRTLSP